MSPRLFLEEQAGEMRVAAQAGGRLRRPVRVCFQPSDQLLQIVRRHRLLCDDELRRACEQRHRLEILQHVVIERVDSAVRHVRARAAVAERVAIGRRASNPTGADPAGGAARILDNDGLTEGYAHAFGQDARKGVARATRGERHDDRDRARGILLRNCVCRDSQSGSNGRRCQRHFSHLHGPVAKQWKRRS